MTTIFKVLKKVGPSVADDMATAAIGAVLLAILCMGLYILLRFRDVAFSIGTIVAVAHDAAIFDIRLLVLPHNNAILVGNRPDIYCCDIDCCRILYPR